MASPSTLVILLESTPKLVHNSESSPKPAHDSEASAVHSGGLPRAFVFRGLGFRVWGLGFRV